MHILKTLLAFTAGCVSICTPAAAHEVDDDLVTKVGTSQIVLARTAGLLAFCDKPGLRRTVIDRISRNGLDEVLASTKPELVVDTLAAVIMRVDTYATGLESGLTLAQLSPERKAEICDRTMTLTDKLLAEDKKGSKPAK
ncbi:hypothetical protein LK996_12240 [Lysobacter sp. A6]|uniref:Uncharacterized protein n=1 Tax=Noviluteimonas lactosilytica TaxID=2888523 RepID=A0ABS8JJR5_9GAMM|nr:hypothetical protein [Lysobacter lactosilyticus]MCC8363843.1 hypothetical protein [Lysobacter lactosilyticus]